MAGKRNKPNRYWQKEDKLKLVKEVIIDNKSVSEVSRENNLDKSQLRKWIKKYYECDIEGIENKRKLGNALMKL